MPLWQRIIKDAHEGLYMVAIMASACTFWKSYLASRVFSVYGSRRRRFCVITSSSSPTNTFSCCEAFIRQQKDARYMCRHLAGTCLVPASSCSAPSLYTMQWGAWGAQVHSRSGIYCDHQWKMWKPSIYISASLQPGCYFVSHLVLTSATWLVLIIINNKCINNKW